MTVHRERQDGLASQHRGVARERQRRLLLDDGVVDKPAAAQFSNPFAFRGDVSRDVDEDQIVVEQVFARSIWPDVFQWNLSG